MDATLTRGPTTVNIPMLDEPQSPIVNVDFGKPEIQIQQTGASDPRAMDQWSGVEGYNILGKYTTSNAYQNAIELAELIKSYSGGEPMYLNIPMQEFDTNIMVAPAAGQDESVSMTYPAGYTERVDIDLALTRVRKTFGEGTQEETTPTATGTGPIQFRNGNTTVDLSANIEVSRGVGRPNSSVSRSKGTYPNYFDKRKAAYDTFELSFEFVENATDTITSLVNDIFKPKSGRKGITLDFNGMYGLGEFSVIPDGGQAIRYQRITGEQGVSQVPTVNVRRILTN